MDNYQFALSENCFSFYRKKPIFLLNIIYDEVIKATDKEQLEKIIDNTSRSDRFILIYWLNTFRNEFQNKAKFSEKISITGLGISVCSFIYSLAGKQSLGLAFIILLLLFTYQIYNIFDKTPKKYCVVIYILNQALILKDTVRKEK